MLNDTQLTFLVSAIGTVNGSTVVDELRKIENQSIKIIGANSTPREFVVTSKFVDEYYEFPSAVDDKDYYLEYVLSFCVEHKVTHLICFIDEEVESFTKNRRLFEENHICLCLPDYSTVSTCHYKDVFSKWVKEAIPEIWIKEYLHFDTIIDSDFPLFAKPIEGRASIGCRAIENPEQFKVFLEETDSGKNFIIQEKIDGDVVGVDIVRNRITNQNIVIQKRELMRNSNGCGTVVEIIDDTRLKKICLSLAEKLDLNGVINAEFFLTQDGPKIIEINPRLPAGTSYSCMAGGNTVINSILIAEGKPCKIDAIQIGKKYARRYETYEM